ncbi:MAG TPA: chemotaxis protein CheB [Tepidisphaeraceae bacterium]|nr:chemotaxis protein CheB [Tepidisphaeraceae bacterium]
MSFKKPERLVGKFAVEAHQSRAMESVVGIVAIAASAGSLLPLTRLLSDLPRDFPAPVIVLQHRAPSSRLPEYLEQRVALPVREAAEGDVLCPGQVLVARPRIHITVNAAGRVRLLDTPPVRFIRPSADVLFRSLAQVYGERTVAVVLSGGGHDGTAGSHAIRAAGGLVLAQDARSSDHPEMPISAFDLGKVDVILRPGQIGPALCALALATAPSRVA